MYANIGVKIIQMLLNLLLFVNLFMIKTDKKEDILLIKVPAI